jgi:hypothetical protein
MIMGIPIMADEALAIAARAGARERQAYIDARGREPIYTPAADFACSNVVNELF